jgi:hypothetical protein
MASFNLGNGISAAGYGAAELYGKKSLMEAQEAIDTRRDEVATERAMRLAEYTEALKGRNTEEQRTAQVSRIDAKASELAESSLAPKRGLIDSGIVDRSSWTPEQQAAVDQSLALDKAQVKADPKTRTDAAIATGDISPKEAATIERDDRRLDAAEKATALKERLEMLREEGRNARADRSAELQEKRLSVMMELGMARLEKAGKATGEAATTKEVLSFLDGSRKELASDAQNLRQLYQSELKEAVTQSERKALEARYAPKFAEVERKRGQIEQDYNLVRAKVGLAPRADSAPPAAAPAATAPKPAASAAPAPKADAKPAPGATQKIDSKAAYDKLPSGARFVAPDGSVRIKP